MGFENGFWFVLFFVFATTSIFAQLNEQDVRDRLELIHSGKSEQVQSELPTLLRQYPNDPGVKYLDAYLTTNGDQAVKKYQSIVDVHPQSEWADDALYKVYQYYYAVGLYKTADAKQTQLNEQYPTSIYAKHEVKPDEKISPPTVEKQEIKTEQPAPETKQETPVPMQSTTGKFTVQVGVFSQERTAQREADRYTTVVGRQAIVFTKLSGERTVYAIGFEGFETEQSARDFGAELKSKYTIESFIVKR
ncbi:MAG: SPOR domain-containing protein [Ignavibacteriales bacterium]|nr:SPOR domain-containing protein [Ignavibacteriales bacterium]